MRIKSVVLVNVINDGDTGKHVLNIPIGVERLPDKLDVYRPGYYDLLSISSLRESSIILNHLFVKRGDQDHNGITGNRTAQA